MTAEAISRDAIMVEVGRGPPIRRVANLTGVARRDVSGILASGGRAVVTAEAVVRDARMVEGGCGGPSPIRMAEFALVAGDDMRGVLSGRGRTVVARETVRRDRAVVEPCIVPSKRAVTV